MLIENIKRDVQALVDEWVEADYLKANDIFVIGCSTSEVAGETIGTSGSEHIAEAIFTCLLDLQEKTNIRLAFQCCEHLNRAICIERETLIEERLDEVAVIPVLKAGGSMASFAFKSMKDPVMVEHIQATAGIDIGETMIGMQMKHVAVPTRFKQKTIGEARVTAARTRAKLIGGARASYENTRMNNSCK